MPFHFVKSYVCLYNSCLTDPELNRALCTWVIIMSSLVCTLKWNANMWCASLKTRNTTPIYTRQLLGLFIWCNNVMNVIGRNMYSVPTTICWIFFLKIRLLQNPDALGFVKMTCCNCAYYMDRALNEIFFCRAVKIIAEALLGMMFTWR